MTASPKMTYAQSSDIKSRTYRKYRCDMKKKAIAELEFLPFLQNTLRILHQDEKLTVHKHGGDAELWFGRSARTITQDPDYRMVVPPCKTFLYEFQYAEEIARLQFFDFKVSKIGKKHKGIRTAHKDREFFYVVKPENKYAFLKPQWIMDNGQEAPVPAWGSRSAYRVPREKLMETLIDGGSELRQTIAATNDKVFLLHFQHDFLAMENEKFSRQLQRVVDDEQLIKIMPRTLDGFYRVCHLLDSMDKQPCAPNVWMVYLLSFFRPDMSPLDFSRLIFSLDFLYFNCGTINDNEKTSLQKAFLGITDYLSARAQSTDGAIALNAHEAPFEETRQMLFSINLLEDMKQNAAVERKMDVTKTSKIFEMVPDTGKTADYIRKNTA